MIGTLFIIFMVIPLAITLLYLVFLFLGLAVRDLFEPARQQPPSLPVSDSRLPLGPLTVAAVLTVVLVVIGQ
jgi:hypothetical protein